MKKILFCYFSGIKSHYIPLDLGYIVMLMKKANVEAEIEIVNLSYTHNISPEEDEKYLKTDRDLILCHNPSSVFFFLDNILWSRTYALARAKKIAQELRQEDPNIFLGVQSYKITLEEIEKSFSVCLFNCAVRKDPEDSFCFLEKILKKEAVAGVSYQSEESNLAVHYPERENDFPGNLDHIPSPYLGGLFDNQLHISQKLKSGDFRAFLYSTRGCPFSCYYCFRSLKYSAIRYFSVERFYDEIEYLEKKFSIKRFFILDDTFVSSVFRLESFVQEFEKRKIKNKNLAQISLSAMIRPELLSPETIALLKEINIEFIQVGLQTINPHLFPYLTRKISLEKFEIIAAAMRKANIELHLDVIMGLPEDTLDYFQKTLDFALSLKPASIQVKQFYTNPNTRFDQEKEAYGIVAEEREWDFENPFVIKTKGEVDDDYFREAAKYTLEKIKDYPQIRWKLVSQYAERKNY